MAKIDPRLAAQIRKVTAHRPQVVLKHILKHGFVTTEELRVKYGYQHPPRAKMDVVEWGIPIEMFRIPDSTRKRKIGAYRLGDPSKVEGTKSGRRVFSVRRGGAGLGRKRTCAPDGER